MRKIRYLLVASLLLWCLPLAAQVGSGFNPDSPIEPDAPNIPVRSLLTLLADPVGGGSPATAGMIEVGTKVTLKANKASNYRFVNWTDAGGNVISESESFQFTKGSADETLTAHYIFDPASIIEPNDPYLQIKVQLNAVAAEGGSVSGGGKYLPGTSVQLNASPSANYVFKNWTDEHGNVISTTPRFNYTVKNVVETLTAHFTYVPSSPIEPNAPDITPKHHVYVLAQEGGTVSASQYVAEGSNIGITANCNSGYEFAGWYKDGLLYNTNRNFTYTVGTEDVTFEARFHYNPASPIEPENANNAKQYIFYIEDANGFQGESMSMSVFLSSLYPMGDLTFQMSFPEGLTPTAGGITYNAQLDGYSKVCTEVDSHTLKFDFTGGELSAFNGALVTFTLSVPEDMTTSTRYPVRMNQISFVDQAGSRTTTNAKNAHIGIYKHGDVNGDNMIDVADVHAMMLYLRNMIDLTDGFIVEAADLTGSGNVTEEDLALVRTIAQENAFDVVPDASEKSLYVTPFATFAGATAEDDKWFAVAMTNDEDIWGLQFDILLPEGMSLTSPPVARNAARLGDEPGDFITGFTPMADGWTRVFVTPDSVEQFITGFDGELFKLHYVTAETMTAGTYTIALRNIKLALQGMAVAYPLWTSADVDVHVHDNVGGYCSICGEALSYSRTLTPDRYGTICLPKAAKAGHYSGAVFYSVAGKRLNDAGTPYHVVLEEVSELQAGRPYVILATANTLEVEYAGAAVHEASTHNGLVGSLEGCDVAEGMYLLSNNTVVKCGTDCNITANHAYFNIADMPVYEDGTGDATKMVVLGMEDPTGIKAPSTSPKGESLGSAYDLCGIPSPRMARGIITIQNSKKVINK